MPRIEDQRPAPHDPATLTPRAEVYKVLDAERDYQDSLLVGPDGRTDGIRKSIGDYMVLMEVAIEHARSEYYGRPGSVPALHEIRKATAIGIQCLEVHGAPLREAPKEEGELQKLRAGLEEFKDLLNLWYGFIQRPEIRDQAKADGIDLATWRMAREYFDLHTCA